MVTISTNSTKIGIPRIPGADPGFQDMGRGGGGHLKKLRRKEGGANIFGVFRVKHHDFTPKNIFFYNFRGGGGGGGGSAPEYHSKFDIFVVQKGVVLISFLIHCTQIDIGQLPLFIDPIGV